MLTHIVCHIFRTARLTSFKLGTLMEDDTRISHRRTTAKVKDERRKVS